MLSHSKDEQSKIRRRPSLVVTMPKETSGGQQDNPRDIQKHDQVGQINDEGMMTNSTSSNELDEMAHIIQVSSGGNLFSSTANCPATATLSLQGITTTERTKAIVWRQTRAETTTNAFSSCS